jgi:hypothetical protein
MAYVANVIEEQLHDLDPNRVRARQRAQLRARELSLFDAVVGKTGTSPDDLRGSNFRPRRSLQPTVLAPAR